MARPIKVPTRIRAGEARRPRRTARLWTRSITRTQTERWAPRRVPMATSMRPRMAMPTRTPGAAGRARAPLMRHTVMEAAVDRTITAVIRAITAAAHHPHSAGGAIILAVSPAGDPGLPARRAGAAEAEGEVGAGAAVAEAGAGVVR